MCEPATLALAATAIAAAGTVTSGISQANQQGYQAKVAAQNAKLDQASARDAMARGAVEEQRQYRRTAQLLGQQRVALAANGLETDFGSAGAIQSDTKTIGWEDAATIRENTMREVKGFEINASNATAQSRAASAAKTATYIKTAFDTGSTILSGAQQTRKLQASANMGG